MKEKLTFPINPEVLGWLLTEYNLDPNTFAKKVPARYARVEKWLSGESLPTFKQALKIAKIFKRNEFFLAADEFDRTQLTAQFRSLPDQSRSDVTFHTRLAIDDANSKIVALQELLGRNKPLRTFINSVTPPRDNISLSAAQIRQTLGISLEAQQKIKKPEDAFRIYRKILEDMGIFTFLDDLENTRAFCIYDEDFPVIYINSKDTPNAKIFSLFHELGHILNRDTDITLGQNFLGTTGHEEVLCNRFASEVLVGVDDFAKISKNIDFWNTDTIFDIAASFCVSTTVIARRLLDQQKITQKFYSQIAEEAIRQATAPKPKKPEDGKKTIVNYYKVKLSKIGRTYTEIVFNQHHSGRISERDVARYLNISYKFIPGLEAVLYK